jgi:hypothetical protein
MDDIILTHALNGSMDTNYKEINALIKQNIESGTLPYYQEKSSPLDTNVINGRHFGDINQQKIELKAAAIGSKRNLWIYGADAQYLGLELKSANPTEFHAAKKANKNFNCKPVLVYANIREKLVSGRGNNSHINVASEGLGCDVQCAYLLDQFTEKSIQKIFNLATLERKLGTELSPVQNRASLIAKEIIKNITYYNTGENEKQQRYHIKRNLTANMQKNAPVLKTVREKYNDIQKNYSPEQKVVFDVYRKHFMQQLTAQHIFDYSDEERKKVDTAFKKLFEQMEKNPEKESLLTHTIFDAYAFTERLSHHNFSFEPIFSAEEELAKRQTLAKIAAPFARKISDDRQQKVATIIDETKRKQLRSRTYGMHINAERGM